MKLRELIQIPMMARKTDTLAELVQEKLPYTDEIRAFFPGIIAGKEIARTATNEEVALLVALHDMRAMLIDELNRIKAMEQGLKKAIKQRNAT